MVRTTALAMTFGMLAVIDEQWDRVRWRAHLRDRYWEPFTEGNVLRKHRAKYIREATEQDHDNFGYNAGCGGRDECEVLDEAGSLPEERNERSEQGHGVVELTILCVVETMHEKTEARANSINFWLNESRSLPGQRDSDVGRDPGAMDRDLVS